MPAATVTTGAKPHGQQQLARDLEVERAVMGQRCRPQSFGEVQRCYPLYFVPHKYSVLLQLGIPYRSASPEIEGTVSVLMLVRQ